MSLDSQCVIPKRIVLSRKGFDSKAGGFASPIFDDGRMISLPIPENVNYPEVSVNFDKLGDADDQERGISSIINRFSPAFDTTRRVHLDPDIRPALRRMNCADPLGYFGQERGAMTQLKNHGVCDPANDSLFLFYGWFKGVRTERGGRLLMEKPSLKESRTHDQHVIWGWLQVDDKPRPIPQRGELAQDLKHIDYHPHIEGRDSRKNNYVFVSRKTLSFVADVAGAGVFSYYDQVLRLTCKNEVDTRSEWLIPGFLRQCARGGIAKARWRDEGSAARVRWIGPGQEFIFDTEGQEQAASEWLASIFHKTIVLK